MTAGRTINTRSQDWGTPKKYVDAIKSVFGGEITLDPCSNKHSIVGANTEYILPKQDGLTESWDYPSIYVNPPYGINKHNRTTIGDWLERCVQAHEINGSEVLALIPVATNTKHWKQNIFGKATAICFLSDTRLKFLINGQNGGKGAPMSCAMIYWGNNFTKFYETFTDYGAIVVEAIKL